MTLVNLIGRCMLAAPLVGFWSFLAADDWKAALAIFGAVVVIIVWVAVAVYLADL